MPTLPREQVLNLAMSAGQPGVDGLIAAVKRFNRGPGGNVGLPQAQLDLLRAASARADTGTRVTPPAKYVHPAAGARVPTTPAGAPQRERSLSGSELARLQRLPEDPARISFADAQWLFQTLFEVTNKGDRGYLESVAAPVRDYHDRAAAKVAIANASITPPLVPAEALAALAESIRAETPDLSPTEAIGRAGDLLKEHTTKRDSERSTAYYHAEQRIAEIDARAAERAAVHRGAAPQWEPEPAA